MAVMRPIFRVHRCDSTYYDTRKPRGESRTAGQGADLQCRFHDHGIGETYDAFQTTLNPTGVPNRAGMDNLVRSLQAQGRFTDRKVAFNEVADGRLATEVAKELGYKLP